MQILISLTLPLQKSKRIDWTDLKWAEPPPSIDRYQDMNNYLKGYPYLFVRETDQTDYFCTLCDAFLKEEELQAHLFDGHQAEDCGNYFVRVVAEQSTSGHGGQKK